MKIMIEKTTEQQKTIENLQKVVSKLSVQDENRKRKRTGLSRHESKKRKTTNVIVFV